MPSYGARNDSAPSSDLASLLAPLLPVTSRGRQAMQRLLVNAGYYSPQAWNRFASVRYVALMGPLLVFLVLLLLVPPALEPVMVAGLVAGPILGWAVPGLIVRNKAAQRLREMEAGMPDMLDLLNMCVSQGMTVPAALHRVGRELASVYPALAKELSIVDDQARIGTLELALKSFSNRVDLPDVHSFTSLLIQTERLGTSVADALADHAESIRENFQQRADENASSATFKLLFPTVFCLMPAVYMFLLGPAIIELNRFFTQDAAQVLNATDRVQQFNTQSPLQQ